VAPVGSLVVRGCRFVDEFAFACIATTVHKCRTYEVPHRHSARMLVQADAGGRRVCRRASQGRSGAHRGGWERKDAIRRAISDGRGSNDVLTSGPAMMSWGRFGLRGRPRCSAARTRCRGVCLRHLPAEAAADGAVTVQQFESNGQRLVSVLQWGEGRTPA
jgi:hypothetical protein